MKIQFYLGFENSYCDQYVTEKFWFRMSQNVLPIVLGGGPYTQMAPPHSHINVEDFESPKELADYLKQLDKNSDDYLSYFSGKQAVVAMACENAHVNDDLIMEPGLVMIFAHGVE